METLGRPLCSGHLERRCSLFSLVTRDCCTRFRRCTVATTFTLPVELLETAKEILPVPKKSPAASQSGDPGSARELSRRPWLPDLSSASCAEFTQVTAILSNGPPLRAAATSWVGYGHAPRENGETGRSVGVGG